jgi:hypothetical protein
MLIQLKNSIPYFPAMVLKSVAERGVEGLALSVIDLTSSSTNASKIPPGELIASSRPVSGPMHLKLWGARAPQAKGT